MNLQKLIDTSAIKTPMNTCHSWGFGGWVGTRCVLTLGSFEITYDKGRNHHRHTGTSAYEALYINTIGEQRVKSVGNPLQAEVVTCYKVQDGTESDPDYVLLFGDLPIKGVKAGDNTLTVKYSWGKATHKVGTGVTIPIHELSTFIL